MKKIILMSFAAAIFLLCSCGGHKEVSKGFNAGSSTNISTGDKKTSNIYTKKDDIKMVNINGCLYYETSEDVDIEAQRGEMDGILKKGAEKFEIPKNNGESNFSGSAGYKIGTAENTIEIPIGDDWEIFRKIETNSDISNYKYCYVLEGRLSNSYEDVEYLVLANETDITFEDVLNKIFGSDTTKMKDIYVLPVDD